MIRDGLDTGTKFGIEIKLGGALLVLTDAKGRPTASKF